MLNSTIEYGKTPYDDVFRTLIVDHKDLLLALLNEMFPDLKHKYTGDEKVIPLNDHYQQNRQDGEQDKRITDSAVMVVDHSMEKRIFHLECQSSDDGSLVIRMFEYDMQIALKAAGEYTKGKLRVKVPNSGILFLRCTKDTPDEFMIELVLPNGLEVSYDVPALKMKMYDIDTIFEKKLFFLIPFYMFNLEQYFKRIEDGNDVAIYEFKRQLRDLRLRLEESLNNGDIDAYLYRSIIDLSNKVNTALTDGKKHVLEMTEAIMRGPILDYEAKSILNKGISQGISKGISKQEKKDIEKLTKYFMSQNPSMTVESAKAAAESILRN